MPCETWGFDGDAIEAAAFAWLAFRRVAALSGNQPVVTGAKGERVLGACRAELLVLQRRGTTALLASIPSEKKHLQRK